MITPALIFLPFVTPIALWVAWSDMKFMRIPNQSVLALVLVFAVAGLVAVALGALPLTEYLWRWSHLVIVLLAGFVANALRLVGAGDAKFAAAMAPFFAAADLNIVLPLFAAILLGAFAAHRGLRLVPAFRNAAPDWQSWTRADFPMGLALSGTLLFYLLFKIFQTV